MVWLAIAVAALLVGFICVCALIAGSREDELRERLARSAELELKRQSPATVAYARAKAQADAHCAERLKGWAPDDTTFI